VLQRLLRVQPIQCTRIRAQFSDSTVIHLRRTDFSILKQHRSGPLDSGQTIGALEGLNRYIIYRCIVGSQAYGLNRESSDIDRRGIYLAPAELEWSLYGVPEQLESRETEECYWELKKFITLALKANPNVLECLFTPLVEYSSPMANKILSSHDIFLSKLVFQTYNGYAMSQFKKLEQDLRAGGEIKGKHAMHLIRLLLQGISVLKDAHLVLDISKSREALLAVRDGVMPWAEVNQWRLELHREFDEAYRATALPDSPNYTEANNLLIRARRAMVDSIA
jgi:predicted nucleotidyltransferase